MHTSVLSSVLALLLAQGPEAPPPETAPEPAADRLQALEAQVAALQERLAEQEVAAVEQETESSAAVAPPSLHIYGFAEVGLQKTWLGAQAALNQVTPTTAPTFMLGNLNLYIDAQPGESWSALAELRFTNLPHGSEFICEKDTPCLRTTTEIYDFTNPGGGWNKIRWGGIVIERAHLQWRHSDLLTVRAGLFLTPFGIWNIDHGSPTLISLMLPEFEANELFPLRQVGVELLGSVLREPWQFGYFAYLSNGRTPGDVDYTTDKMVGGRVFARHTGRHHWMVGLSGLTGRYSDVQRVRSDTFVGGTSVRKELVAFREWAAGADLSLDVGALRVRTELAARTVEYERDKRDAFFNLRGGIKSADRLEWDAYTLAAYHLPFWGLEPFLYFEVYRFPTPLSEGLMSPSVGLNVHFTAYAQLKVQYLRGIFLDELSDPTNRSARREDFHLFGSRLVLAF